MEHEHMKLVLVLVNKLEDYSMGWSNMNSLVVQ